MLNYHELINFMLQEATTQTVREPGTTRTVRMQVDMRSKGPTKKTKG